MDEKLIILQGVSEKSLVSKITDSINEILTANSEKSNFSEQLLTINEVCDLLKITKTTLWSYTKKGKLQSYGIGNRVLYKRSEVENSLTPLKK
ncbi:helix-turn-helix domain-containing protein [uncultured Eudoraea sp.]|uniref:helix-turn-helix domain-containing protein n=1 Tax=uncultured Eudoraea sp. TaxID=1035614 RepID=UPI002620D238|nr:helix-turn-helix domain-containing protein [uncultured Eudoraea sp.]